MTTCFAKIFLPVAVLLIFAALPLRVCAADGSQAYGASLTESDSSAKLDVVKKYKADPDGNEDSRHAIQKALNAAKEKGSPSRRQMVYIPAGTYKISAPLKIYSNTDLLLDSGAVILKCFNSGCMLRNDVDGSGGYSASENISIRGGTWDGNTSEYSGAYSFSNIRIGHANNVLFSGVTVLNNKNGHHLEIGGVKGLTISNCYFGGYSGALLKEAIQLDVMNCSEVFAGYAPFDDTTCENVVISGCTFKNLMRGIGSHTAVVGRYYTDITIKDNYFENVSDVCILLYNYRKCTVSGNTMTDSGGGVTFNYLSDEKFKHFFPPVAGFDSAAANIIHDADTVISGNDISTYVTSAQDMPFGIKIYGGSTAATSTMPAGDYYISNVDILNNTVRSSDAALKMNDTTGCTVSGNTFSATDGGNDCQMCLLTYCSSMDIRGNTMKNSRRSGISVSDCSELKIEENTFSSIPAVGVLLKAVTDSTVNGNSISSCDVGGIKIDEGCASITAGKNVIKQKQGYGIKIEGAGSDTDIKVKSNDISGCEVGIYCINKGKALLTNNTFEAVADKVKADEAGLVTLAKAKKFAAEEVTDNKIKLTWKAISEADGINVFRRTAMGEYELVASVESGSIFQDERLFSGTNYIYKLVPYIMINGEASGSTESDEIHTRTKVNIENAYIECVSEAAFTGRPVTPRIRIVANSNELTEGVDYSYAYSNNLYTGTAQVAVTGRGDYIGVLNYNFEIKVGSPIVNDAARRTQSRFSNVEKRTYKVSCVPISTQLLAGSDERVNAAQRTIDAIKMQVPYKTVATTAIWNGSGFSFY